MKKNNNGFTIIEVVLVLAIAGLIFLAVFIALPALQRGQRDNQRRTDASRFGTQLQSFATNNNGKMPTTSTQISTIATTTNGVKPTGGGSFIQGYLLKGSEGFNDPKTGEYYGVTVLTAPAQPTLTNTFVYLAGGSCDGETVISGGGNRNAAVAIQLEGSGTYCLNVQK